LIRELESALALLVPKNRGLEDLLKVSLSAESLAAVKKTLEDHVRRRTLLQTLIDALSALEGDGYPEVPKFTVPSEVFKELQEQLGDIEAAIAEFLERAMATTMSVSLGLPGDK